LTITYKTYAFPTFPISKQLFHVPGASVDGGITSGGARIRSPEPGGFSMLEIQPSLQPDEWSYPLSSWLMSKTNGEILRVRLAPTPQVAGARNIITSVPWDSEQPWSNQQNWAGDVSLSYATTALYGTTTVKIDMLNVGEILQVGHVLGHAYDTYMVDEIEYDENSVATMTVKPPLRRNITAGDDAFPRPWFTGQIVNGEEVRTTYDAENNGFIQIGKIILSEVVI
jgi:hypothetical protein